MFFIYVYVSLVTIFNFQTKILYIMQLQRAVSLY
jgi:hypothetical protein